MPVFVGSVLSDRSRATAPAERAPGSRRRASRVAGVLLGAVLALGAVAAPVSALSPPIDERDPADVAAITIAQTAEADQVVSAPTDRAEYHYDIGVACRALADPDCGIPEIRIPVDEGLAPLLPEEPEEHARFWSVSVAGAGPLADPAVRRDGDTLVITGTQSLLPGDSALVTLALGSSEARYVPGERAWELAPELWLGDALVAVADPVSSTYSSTLPSVFAPALSIPTGGITRPGDQLTLELHAPCATAEFDGEQQLVGGASKIELTIPSAFEQAAGSSTVPENTGVFNGPEWTWTPAPKEHRCGDPATGSDDGVTFSLTTAQDAPLHKNMEFTATVTMTDLFGRESSADTKISVWTCPATLDTEDAGQCGPTGISDAPGGGASPTHTERAHPTPHTVAATDPAGFSLRHSVTDAGEATLTWTPAEPAELSTATLYAGIPTPGNTTQIGRSTIGASAAPLAKLGAVPAGFTLHVSTADVPCAPELGERPGCIDDWAAPGSDLSAVTALRLTAAEPTAANSAAEFTYAITPPAGAGVAASTIAGTATAGERALPAAETAPQLLLGVPEPEAPALTIDYRVDGGLPSDSESAADTEDAAWTTTPAAKTAVVVSVRNTGDVPLDDFTVVRERLRGSAELSPLACGPRGPVEPGGTIECTGTIAALPEGELHGSIAEVQAVSPAGTTVSASNELWLLGGESPVTPGPGTPTPTPTPTPGTGTPGGTLATTGAPGVGWQVAAGILLVGAGLALAAVRRRTSCER